MLSGKIFSSGSQRKKSFYLESVSVLSIFFHKNIVFSKKIKVLYFEFTLLFRIFDLLYGAMSPSLNTILDGKIKFNAFNLVKWVKRYADDADEDE